MEFVANCQKGGVMSIRDYNSENNQAIKEKFVDKEVFGSVSSLMERIVKCEMKEISIERGFLCGMMTGYMYGVGHQQGRQYYLMT